MSMTETRHAGVRRVGGAWIVLAALLLVGVLALAWSLSHNSHPAFYAGLAIILAGVLTGVRKLVTGESPPHDESDR